jgi:hypothetical protein
MPDYYLDRGEGRPPEIVEDVEVIFPGGAVVFDRHSHVKLALGAGQWCSVEEIVPDNEPFLKEVDPPGWRPNLNKIAGVAGICGLLLWAIYRFVVAYT